MIIVHHVYVCILQNKMSYSTEANFFSVLQLVIFASLLTSWKSRNNNTHSTFYIKSQAAVGLLWSHSTVWTGGRKSLYTER